MEGVTEEIIRANSWQFRQILGRGVHGILLCQAESASAVQAFVESCRYPINRVGVGNGLDKGRRGVGSENSATAIWGIERNDYVQRADPWPLNPNGELLLGVKIESAEALPYIEEILAVPGIGFAEMGPGDLSMSLGYLNCPRPFPPEIQETHERVRNACAENNVAFLSSATVDNIKEKIDEGVRIIQPGGNEEVVRIGREYSDRVMPW